MTKKLAWSLVAIAAAVFSVPRVLAGDPAQSKPNAIADVAGAFERLPAQGESLEFSRGSTDLPSGGHLQGIQMRFDPAKNRQLAFLSHDSLTVGYLVVAEFPAALDGDGRVIHVHTFPSDGQSPPLRHAGGVQMLGDVLAVGVEDNQQRLRSEVQFWDVANPLDFKQLEHLTIKRAGARQDKTAGAVGIIAWKADHLVAVANWDSRAVDFYVSNGKPLADRDCRFTPHARWQVASADKSGWIPDQLSGTYQAINLVGDADGGLFLLGFDTSPTAGDYVDLFAIDLTQQPDKLLRKLARKSMRLAGENHFRAAGGVWIRDGRLAILASEHDLKPTTRINVAR